MAYLKVQISPCRQGGKLVTIAGVPTEIWTRNLANMKVTQRLSVTMHDAADPGGRTC